MAAHKLPDTGFFEKHAGKIEYGAPSGCWLWSARIDRYGYGKVRARGTSRLAHREAYEAIHGPGSANGLAVRHKCDVRACVNPDHLLLGTNADNSRDMVERDRQAKGVANGNAKLTEDDVMTIRAEYVRRSSTHGLVALARRFGVHHTLIGFIVRRVSWTHLT